MAHRISLTEDERLYLVRDLRVQKKVAAIWSKRRFPKTVETEQPEKIPDDVRQQHKAEVVLLIRLLRKLRPS